MVTDDDYLVLARELLSCMMDLQTEIGTLRLAVQKHGISLEELQECRAELERRLNPEKRKAALRAAGRVDLLEYLRNFQGTVQ
jgi:hypothetical protein